MKRNAVVVAVIAVLLASLIWAGVTNRRHRNAEAAKVRQAQTSLVPDKGSSSASSSAFDDGAPPDLRGKTATAFTLKTLDGKTVSLADFKGKPVLVNFWATWCAPCKVEMPWFQAFQQQYAAQGLQIVGILEDDAPDAAVRNILQKTGVTYPVMRTDSKIDKAYGGVDYLPSSYFVNRDGVIVAQASGLGSKDEIEANIRKIVAQ